MSRVRIQLEPGYLLSARSYRDTSLLIEVFTSTQGRVGLIARGARGPRSKTRALLQVLQPLLLSWHASGDLGSLVSVESAGPPLPLCGERVFYGWYINELLLKLLQRHDPHPALFEAYATALAQLAGEHAEAALRIFEKRLLAELGYGLHLPETLLPEQRYLYDPNIGVLPAGAGGASYAGTSLIALEQETLDSPAALADARHLLHQALEVQLAGKTLETPRLLRELRGRRVATANPVGQENECDG
ncbi:MAG: DNA repair protein RecO [Stenotrophobium sp.]